MTTTLSAIRTAVDPSAIGGVVTLDPQTSPTDIFFTAGANISISLVIPNGPGIITADYDGSRFRITKSTTSGTLTINYSSASTTFGSTAARWAEFVLTCPTLTSTPIWRLSAVGTL